MTILDEFIDQHKNWCWCEMSKNYMPDKCTCGKYQVAAELAALRAEIAILRDELTTYREALVKIAEIVPSWEGRSNAIFWSLGDIARAVLIHEVSIGNMINPIEDALRSELAALKEATWIPAIPGYLPMESGDYRVLCREGISKAAYTTDYQWDDYPYEVIAWKPLKEEQI